jgi:transketolase
MKEVDAQEVQKEIEENVQEVETKKETEIEIKSVEENGTERGRGKEQRKGRSPGQGTEIRREQKIKLEKEHIVVHQAVVHQVEVAVEAAVLKEGTRNIDHAAKA